MFKQSKASEMSWMRNLVRTSLKALLPIVIVGVALSGCTSTQRVGVSDSLPSETQMRMNSAEDFSADFQFSAHSNGDQIEIDTGPAVGVYSMNEVLEGRLTQLMRSKFGSVDQSSENSVSVSITELNTKTNMQGLTDEGDHSIDMTMNVEIKRDGETFTRSIERSASIDITRNTGGMKGSTISVDKDKMNEFIAQFVVGVDSFIDSNFGVK